MEKIKKVLETPLSNINMTIDEITYKNKNLNIILDSPEIINVDKIVEASRLISKILDEHDFIKEQYILDVSSKEKGDNKNE